MRRGRAVDEVPQSPQLRPEHVHRTGRRPGAAQRLAAPVLGVRSRRGRARARAPARPAPHTPRSASRSTAMATCFRVPRTCSTTPSTLSSSGHARTPRTTAARDRAQGEVQPSRAWRATVAPLTSHALTQRVDHGEPGDTGEGQRRERPRTPPRAGGRRRQRADGTRGDRLARERPQDGARAVAGRATAAEPLPDGSATPPGSRRNIRPCPRELPDIRRPKRYAVG